jgi:hypothetical protein
VKIIAAHHTAGRMNDVAMTNIGFWIERTLNKEWSGMLSLTEICARVSCREAQAQCGSPALGGSNWFCGLRG